MWQTGMWFGVVYTRNSPEVWLWDVTTPSAVFQSKVVVHRLAEFLLAAEIVVQHTYVISAASIGFAKP